MDSEELLAIFGGTGTVERAWLIQHRRDTFHFNPDHVHNHRGFGFVVFRHEGAVEQLLGQKASDFLPVRGGRMLEVKRAVSSNEMMKNSRLTSAGEDWQPLSHYQQSSSEQLSGLPTLPVSVGTTIPQQILQPMPQHAAVAAATTMPHPTLQQQMSQQVTVATAATTDLRSRVPPWPLHPGSAPLQVGAPVNTQMQCFFVPIPMAPVPAPTATATTYADWTKVFQSTPESMLLQAMPDHYED
jgi:hypothetical protein